MKNRTEMKEMDLEQVVGGVTVSDLLYRKNRRVTIEEAIVDSRKKFEVVLLGGHKKETGKAAGSGRVASAC